MTMNPYPGLRPFSTDEYNVFFGRDGQAEELLERLGRTRFLAVVGTSGSGKSSLVRAGMLPALYGGLMTQAGSDWRVAVLRPGSDPVGELARALGAADMLGALGADEDFQAALVETTLRRSNLGLVEAVRQARLAAHENVLVVVDQFEEIFRFQQARGEERAADDAAGFVKLLLEAARQREVPIYVVLTMRSDFLGDCAQFWGLPEAINEGQYLIPRMTRDERREAVTGPAAVGGGALTPALVNRLLNDMGDSPDQLPILQHALMRTWDFWTQRRRDGEPLDIEHYAAVGTMSDALSRHAEEAFAELPDDDSRDIAEQMFKALTERGTDNRETRRPTRLAEICAVAEASEEKVAAVVEVFRGEGRSFLMPPAGVALTPETVIDISHESLIRNWDRLKKWVDEEAQSARMYMRLVDSATLHAEGSGGFLRDPNLRLIWGWWETTHPTRAWAARYQTGSDFPAVFLTASDREEQRPASVFDYAMHFLRASAERQMAEESAERERERSELERARAFADQQARTNRKLRLTMAALAAIMLLAVGTAAFALKASADAVESRTHAEQSQMEALESADRANAAKLDLEKSLKALSEAKGIADEQRRRADRKAQEAVESKKATDVALGRARTEAERANTQARLAAKHAADEKQAKEDAENAQMVALVAQERAQRAEKFAYEQRDAALKAADEIRAAQEKTNAVQEANRLFREASADSKRGEQGIDDAARKYEKAIEAFGKMDDTPAVAATYVELGEMLTGSEDTRRLEGGIDMFGKAVKLYEASKDYNAAAFAAARIGEFIANPANLGKINEVEDETTAEDVRDAALEAFGEALKHYETAKNSDGIINMLTRMGSLSGESSVEGERDVDFYERTLPLFDAAKQRDKLAAMLIQIGQAYKARDDSRRAGEFFERAIKTQQDAGDLAAAADIILDLGFPRDRSIPIEGLPATMETSAKRVEGLWVNDTRGRADGLRNVGQRYLAWCEKFVSTRYRSVCVDAIPKALDYSTRALALYEGGNDRKGQALTLVNLGSIYETWGPPRSMGQSRDQEKDEENARDFYRKALALLTEEGEMSKQRAEALEKLARLVERAKTRPDDDPTLKYTQAFRYYDEARFIYERLKDYRSARRVKGAMDDLKKRREESEPRPSPQPPPTPQPTPSPTP